MGIRNYQEITVEEMDILREAGNIASGNAMTALGKLTGCTLDMNVAKVRIEKIQELTEILGSADEVIAGMIINVYGDFNAMLLLALETQSALKMINLILGEDVRDIEQLSEIDYSVLSETGNILAGSYLSALNQFTGLQFDVSTPQMAIDMAGAILSYPAIEFVRSDNTMLFIETEFKDTNSVLSGTYILILDNTSYNRVLDSLGAEV